MSKRVKWYANDGRVVMIVANDFSTVAERELDKIDIHRTRGHMRCGHFAVVHIKRADHDEFVVAKVWDHEVSKNAGGEPGTFDDMPHSMKADRLYQLNAIKRIANTNHPLRDEVMADLKREEAYWATVKRPIDIGSRVWVHHSKQTPKLIGQWGDVVGRHSKTMVVVHFGGGYNRIMRESYLVH